MKNPTHLPKGFRCAGVAAGIKQSGGLDMALITSDVPAAAAGIFTTNQVCAAPVKLCREHLSIPKAQAIVINSGLANACTGAAGMAVARQMARETAAKLGCEPEEVLVCSTGKIGPPLPIKEICSGIGLLAETAANNQVQPAAEAMMTTDTRPKVAEAEIEVEGIAVRLVGLAKGAGMIAPNMATMIVCITTDAAVEPAALQRVLKQAANRSFNRISIDGDQSTNDTALVLANGAAGTAALNDFSSAWATFSNAFETLCFELAMMVVHDGEGADKFVTVAVQGAETRGEAELAARAVANSMLNKTAWAGCHPNWGRIMDAVGYSGARVVEEQVNVYYDDVQAVAQGHQSEAPHDALVQVVSQSDFSIRIDLGLGAGEATVYTCNCTEEYVQINH